MRPDLESAEMEPFVRRAVEIAAARGLVVSDFDDYLDAFYDAEPEAYRLHAAATVAERMLRTSDPQHEAADILATGWPELRQAMLEWSVRMRPGNQSDATPHRPRRRRP